MTEIGTAPWPLRFPLSPRRRRVARLALAGTTLALIGLSMWLLLGAPPFPWQQTGTAWQRVTESDGKVLRVAVPGDQPEVDAGSSPRLGAHLPDFSLPTTAGTPLRLRDLKGHPVLLNFWATWCLPCRKEFPELVRVSQAAADQGLIVVGVDEGESRGQVVQFAQEFSATFPMALDNDTAVADRYHVLGLPTSLFLDRDGVLRAQQIGPLTQDSLKSKLAQVGITVDAGQ
jgi:cytochrome c biogenesis protein CcmG, thiol:disulfide interchange protein DsbE